MLFSVYTMAVTSLVRKQSPTKQHRIILGHSWRAFALSPHGSRDLQLSVDMVTTRL